MIKNSFKRCLLIYLRPLRSVPKFKVGKSPAHANRLVIVGVSESMLSVML